MSVCVYIYIYIYTNLYIYIYIYIYILSTTHVSERCLIHSVNSQWIVTNYRWTVQWIVSESYYSQWIVHWIVSEYYFSYIQWTVTKPLAKELEGIRSARSNASTTFMRINCWDLIIILTIMILIIMIILLITTMILLIVIIMMILHIQLIAIVINGIGRSLNCSFIPDPLHGRHGGPRAVANCVPYQTYRCRLNNTGVLISYTIVFE